MKLKDGQQVPLEVCKQRALKYLQSQAYPYCKANCIALAIWPAHQMTSQGAGASASRILKRLGDDGLVRWNSGGSDWGWEITRQGRSACQNS